MDSSSKTKKTQEKEEAMIGWVFFTWNVGLLLFIGYEFYVILI